MAEVLCLQQKLGKGRGGGEKTDRRNCQNWVIAKIENPQ
jgi:hypothetical protein